MEKHDEELKRQRDNDDRHDKELEKHGVELAHQRKFLDAHDHLLKELSERVTRLEDASVPIGIKAAVFVSIVLSLGAIIIALIR